MILSRHIEQVFSRHKNKPAISHYLSANTLQTVTYGQLEERSKSLAIFLTRHGMKPNDLIMSYMNKSLDSAIAILAAMLNGGAACSLNSRMKPHHVVNISALAKPKFIILNRSTISQILKSKEAMASDVNFVFYSETPELVKREKSHATTQDSAHEEHNNVGIVKDSAPFHAFSYHSGSCGYCLFTSGSTGEQKGVLISRDDLLRRVTTEIEDYELIDDDHLLSLLPFSFDVGLNQFLASILSGAHLIILNSWFPKDVVSAILRLGITGVSAVPTIWADMLCFPQEKTFHEEIKTLRYITVSGGDLAPACLVQLKRYFEQVRIYKTYGQSETFRSSMLKPHDFEKKMTSVGQPVKGTRLFILDENGMTLSPESEGEIVHYGAGTMLGYINDLQETRKKIRGIPESLRDKLTEGSVVFTGDRGKMDSDGFLYILGREDGMIKTMGYRVYPKEVENCIHDHPGVRNAAVVGISDGRKGQIMIAEVVAKDTLKKDDLITHLRERLPSYMVPEDVYLVESLPLSENGKIRYAEIKGRYEERRFLCPDSKGRTQKAH